jgi:hypothetical protein
MLQQRKSKVFIEAIKIVYAGYSWARYAAAIEIARILIHKVS